MTENNEENREKPDKKKPFFSVTEDDATASYGASVERPGAEIGPYRLLSVLGEGGFGIVYLAEQRQPIRRRVALKIVKPGMDSKEILARFEAERQTLALLDHPNIAKIHDAGMTKGGRPYFVMEYVKGTPITEYCDRHTLTIETRLRLFQDVCSAIQYAHQKGIIHRDIKPSNILISTEEEQCLPKVIDFGVAKATTQNLTDRTLYTEVGQVIGTPEYMSPEQVEMNAEGIDTRSDVYSLGVVFYELLVGVLPFDPDTLRSKGIDAMRRVILNEEPRTPSTRLTGLAEEAKRIAEKRQIDLTSLARCLRRELEWIPLKAMRKNPERRYRSASGISDDIQNYLDGNPLIAGPEAVSYRLCKFVRRHKTSVMLTVAIVVLLIAGFIVSSGLYVIAKQAQKTSDERSESLRQSLYRSAVARAYAEHQIGYAANIESLLESCPADLRGWEWQYLRYICDEALFTIDAHDHTVTAVAFGPSGRQIVSASTDRTVKIWDSETGARIMTLPAKSWVICMSVSPDGSRIASGGLGQVITVWDASTGENLIRMRPGREPKVQDLLSLAFSPDGQRIASGDSLGVISVSDTLSGAEVMSWNGHDTPVPSVTFSPDGSRIVSGGRDKLLKIWNAVNGNLIRTIQGHSGEVSSVLFSPNSKHIVAGDLDGYIKRWDVGTGAELLSFRAHKGEVASISFSPDGRQLASGSADCNIKLWDVSTGNELAVLRGHSQAVKSVAFTGDGQRLVSGGQDRVIKVWSASTSRDRRTLIGHEGHVQSVSFSPDSKFLASCGDDRTVRIWKRDTSEEVARFEAHEGIVNCVAFNHDGSRLASSSWRENTIKIWDWATGERATTLSGHTDWVYSVAFMPDGEHIVSGGNDKTIRIWDTRTGAQISTLHGHQEGISHVVISPDGEFIASSSWDTIIKIWDIATGSEIASLKGMKGPEGIVSLAFSPDGRRIGCIGTIKELGVPTAPIAKIWDIGKCQEVMTLDGHSSSVTGIDFSPDGRRIATASSDDTIRIWDAANGHEILVLQMTGTSNPWIWPSVAYSPDGKTLAVTSFDKVLLFDSAAPAGN